jgi:phosphoglycolate phosphatase
MPPPLVVFDLDGTLVDTAPDLIDALNIVLAREGLAPVPYETARNAIGGGARRMVERALTAEGRPVTTAQLDQLLAHFLEHYEAHIADRSRAFPSVEATLDLLSGRGYRLAVCTNKLEKLSVKLLDALGLSRRFAAICGQDTFGVQKPDPAILLGTIDRAGGGGGGTVMVGDSATDIKTARTANIPVIAVDFGYTEVPVAQLAPDRLISSYAALPAAVFDLIPLRI